MKRFAILALASMALMLGACETIDLRRDQWTCTDHKWRPVDYDRNLATGKGSVSIPVSGGSERVCSTWTRNEDSTRP